VELAPAFESPTTNESASKLDAFQTLREVRLRLCRLCRAAQYCRFPIGRLGNLRYIDLFDKAEKRPAASSASSLPPCAMELEKLKVHYIT